MSPPRAVVIGGGIGGLTTALALHRRGWHTTVLERAAGLAPVGAALTLAPNAQRALGTLGLGTQITELASWRGDGLMCDPAGRPLTRTHSEAVVARFGAPLVVLRRSDLIDLIVDRLPAGTVRTGEAAFLTHAGSARHKAHVSTPNGRHEADLVVAADGVRSPARAILFPDHPGPAFGGWTVWRLLAPTPGSGFVPHESWGRAQVWGTLVRDADSVFIYACAATDEGGRSADGEKAELRRRFGRWHDPVPTLIDSVPEHEILRNDVHHMQVPLTAFHRGRTALLGDAAHAMVPTLGQGANMAIEDGVVLAHHAAPDADPLVALARYDRDRRPRTQDVVRRAARLLKLTSLRSPVTVAARDGLMRMASRTVPGLLLRGFDGIADWRPPTAGPGTSPARPPDHTSASPPPGTPRVSRTRATDPGRP
ncbi:FAD-dependent oxidoreductase [Streptomyces tubbatahanensis]|uniref:FAD-dependent oxidoreductase n=1 Tax=Streptomyces tubbatahanensis TaxID=2923272 RepID=A0ABY3XXK3_9ACTN|nr:FAD-dependent monooxygenase [Streptomyces tubbatahanensis]UNS99115.1 FAD-dependent oxidoreductase [Streptomyces tubbatahanensis]